MVRHRPAGRENARSLAGCQRGVLGVANRPAFRRGAAKKHGKNSGRLNSDYS